MRRYRYDGRLYDEREDIDVSPARIIEVEIGVEVGSDMKDNRFIGKSLYC